MVSRSRKPMTLLYIIGTHSAQISGLNVHIVQKKTLNFFFVKSIICTYLSAQGSSVLTLHRGNKKHLTVISFEVMRCELGRDLEVTDECTSIIEVKISSPLSQDLFNALDAKLAKFFLSEMPLKVCTCTSMCSCLYNLSKSHFSTKIHT